MTAAGYHRGMLALLALIVAALGFLDSLGVLPLGWGASTWLLLAVAFVAAHMWIGHRLPPAS